MYIFGFKVAVKKPFGVITKGVILRIGVPNGI
jgi:hypothetical protein